jgi:3-oxoacyl-[acyl-carrier protein] reductase
LTRALAREHDLVVGDAAPGLVDQLESLGAAVEAVQNVADLSDPDASPRLVGAALERFGRVDAAAIFGGGMRPAKCGSGVDTFAPFVESSIEDLRVHLAECVEAPYNFLQAILPVMLKQGSGQILISTSAFGARPVPGSSLYSTARAAGTMLMRNVAAEVVDKGVQVNSIGPMWMDGPENLASFNGDRARMEAEVPMGRLAQMEELAHIAMPFLDGKSTFVTGHFVPFAGGWA